MQPMRGSNEKLKMFAVPYSEHSSFRELSMFCCAVEIGKIVPTVNVGSKKSREKMNKWIEKWEQVRRKGGFRLVEEGGEGVW
jgi:DNA cross-link repair 1A protein